MCSDPGYISTASSDAEIKYVSDTLGIDSDFLALEELVDAGRLNGTNFCIVCMVGEWQVSRLLMAGQEALTFQTLPAMQSLCGSLRSVKSSIRAHPFSNVSHCPWIWNCGGFLAEDRKRSSY
jgi:hypothetical protein